MRKLKLLVFVPVVLAVGLFTSPRQAEAVGNTVTKIKVGKFALESGLFNVLFSKEVCSCHFIDGLTLEECQATDNLPSIAHSLVKIEIDEQAKTVSSRYIKELVLAKFVGITPGPPASARVVTEHPEQGCVLTLGAGL